MSRSAEAFAEALRLAEHVVPLKPPQTKPTTFEGLGLHPPIVAALRAAFPNIKHPTETQAKFIPAVLTGKDVLLKDETGSGKSFGLVVALLNKPRVKSKERAGKLHITSLVLVPHRDLAHQLYHWIQKMAAASSVHPPPSISSVAQVLVRDGVTHLTEGVRSLHETPPHILIGTPQAILDIYREDPKALQLPHLSSVVVDEVDYLIETVPKKDPKKSFHKSFVKASRKLLAHPGVTRQLLDIIYAKRIETNDRRQDEPGVTQHLRRTGMSGSQPFSTSPQLILSSATLRSHLNNYLFDESGWLNKDYLVKVKGSKKLPDTKRTAEQYPHDGLGGNGVLHSVLLVSDDQIRNIEGAVPLPSTLENGDLQPISAETLFAPSANAEPAENDPELAKKYADTPTPFNPNMLEAVATAFALDVPSVALLVLAGNSPVRRAVFELREMGVNAQELDLLANEKGRAHLLRGGATGQDNPTLLVATLATTRGLDLPELSHVFILGIPEGPKVNGRTVDAYVHIAGRVGRFGRGGKVITVVEKQKDVEDVEEYKGEGRRLVTEGSKMLRILNTIQERPVQFEHFD